MTDETPQALLRDAADKIDLALSKLDTRRHEPLNGEQRGKFVNFAHAKTHLRFADTPRKLRREANFLDAKIDNTRR